MPKKREIGRRGFRLKKQQEGFLVEKLNNYFKMGNESVVKRKVLNK